MRLCIALIVDHLKLFAFWNLHMMISISALFTLGKALINRFKFITISRRNMMVVGHILIELQSFSSIFAIRVLNLWVGERVVTITTLAKHICLHLHVVHRILAMSLLLITYHRDVFLVEMRYHLRYIKIGLRIVFRSWHTLRRVKSAWGRWVLIWRLVSYEGLLIR